jgi:hypothetical protein
MQSKSSRACWIKGFQQPHPQCLHRKGNRGAYGEGRRGRGETGLKNDQTQSNDEDVERLLAGQKKRRQREARRKRSEERKESEEARQEGRRPLLGHLLCPHLGVDLPH